jgi:hypothetical protein
MSNRLLTKQEVVDGLMESARKEFPNATDDEIAIMLAHLFSEIPRGWLPPIPPIFASQQ